MKVIIVGDTGIKDAVISAPFTDDQTPILYVKKDSIPAAVQQELFRLAPDEIVVFGGTARVSDSVFGWLNALAPTTRIAGPSVFSTAIAASQTLHPIVVEPPVEPPSGMFIPVLQGPKLMHDGNPAIIPGFTHDSNETRIIVNTKIVGSVTIKQGLVIFRDCELDGNGGEYSVAGWGGRGLVERSWVHGAKDGFKDGVDSIQATITDLHLPAGTHGDCVQLQSSGATATHKWGYFDCGVKSGANAAFIIKNDLGNGSLQEITVEDSYIDGGTFTVYLRDGNAGGAPDKSHFRRVTFGGHAMWGQRLDNGNGWDHRRNTNPDGTIDYTNLGDSLSADAPAPSTWDVTHI